MEELNQAITALRAGNKLVAQKMLAAILLREPDNEVAWRWMSLAVDDIVKRRVCLQQVLRINPSNRAAKLRLESLVAEPVAVVHETYQPQPSALDGATPSPMHEIVQPDPAPKAAPRDPKPAGSPYYFCPNCGVTVTGYFCSNCGVALYQGGSRSQVEARLDRTLDPVNLARLTPPASAKPAQPVVTVVQPPPPPPVIVQTPPVRRPEPAQPDYYSPRYARNMPPPSRFTAKRVIASIGLVLIVFAGIMSWENTRQWRGILGGGYVNFYDIGISTTEGMVSTGLAILGMVLLFALEKETIAHVIAAFLSTGSSIAAYFYMDQTGHVSYWMFGEASRSMEGVGVYVVFVGTAITWACFLIPSRSRKLARQAREDFLQ